MDIVLKNIINKILEQYIQSTNTYVKQIVINLFVADILKYKSSFWKNYILYDLSINLIHAIRHYWNDDITLFKSTIVDGKMLTDFLQSFQQAIDVYLKYNIKDILHYINDQELELDQNNRQDLNQDFNIAQITLIDYTKYETISNSSYSSLYQFINQQEHKIFFILGFITMQSKRNLRVSLHPNANNELILYYTNNKPISTWCYLSNRDLSYNIYLGKYNPNTQVSFYAYNAFIAIMNIEQRIYDVDVLFNDSSDSAQLELDLAMQIFEQLFLNLMVFKKYGFTFNPTNLVVLIETNNNHNIQQTYPVLLSYIEPNNTSNNNNNDQSLTIVYPHNYIKLNILFHDIYDYDDIQQSQQINIIQNVFEIMQLTSQRQQNKNKNQIIIEYILNELFEDKNIDYKNKTIDQNEKTAINRINNKYFSHNVLNI